MPRPRGRLPRPKAHLEMSCQADRTVCLQLRRWAIARMACDVVRMTVWGRCCTADGHVPRERPSAASCIFCGVWHPGLDKALRGRCCRAPRAQCKLWGYLGPLPVIIASIKRPPAKNKNYPEALGIYWRSSKIPGRRVVCLQLRFSEVLWAARVGASWDGSPVLDH